MRIVQKEEGPDQQPPIEPMATTGIVDVPIATIHEQPDRNSTPIATVESDVILPVKGETRAADAVWYLVEYFGRQGYIHLWDFAVGETPARPASAPPANDWMTIVPDAVSRTGKPLPSVAGGTVAHGGLVTYANYTISYRANPLKRKQELATAAPLGPGVTQDQVDRSVAAIKEARVRIRQRFLKKVSHPKAGTGYQATAAREREAAAKDAEWQPTVEATERYLAWLNLPTTLPALVSDPQDMRWLVFKRVFPMEGDPSAVMTYDQTNITWGVGFSGHGGAGVGQTEEMMTRLFNQSPEAKELFWNAGLTVVDNQPVVVDTDRGWKLHEQDAELYIRADRELLSLMINAAQGEFLGPGTTEDPLADSPQGRIRQKVLDAQFETFFNDTLRGRSLTGWNVDAAAVAAHAVHSGAFDWGEFGNNLAANVQHIKSKLRRQAKLYLFPMIVPEEWRSLAP